MSESAKEIHQFDHSPAIEQAKKELLHAIAHISGLSWQVCLIEVGEELNALIESSASRLQEVETGSPALQGLTLHQAATMMAFLKEECEKEHTRAEQAKLRLQEVEAERAWQPIESAPKDGTFLLLWCVGFEGGTDGHFDVGSWHDIYSGGSWWERGMEYTVHPTHWMPLPSPPQEQP